MSSPTVYDVHCHFVPPATRQLLADTSSIELTERGIVRGSAVLPLPPRLSDRAAFDDHRTRLSAAIVAPPPALYLEDVAATHEHYVRELNDALADVARGEPALHTLAWLPLTDPSAAVAEVERVATDDAVAGVVVGTSLGSAVADTALDPVWQAVAAAQLGIFLHPDSDPFDLTCRPLPNPSTVGFPAATTAVAASLLTRADGFWSAGSRLCLSHGSGFLGLSLGRMTRADPSLATTIDRRLAQVWVDSVVLGPGGLALAVAIFGADRVLSGSDWPFPLSLTAAEMRAQLSGENGPAGSTAAWCPRVSSEYRS